MHQNIKMFDVMTSNNLSDMKRVVLFSIPFAGGNKYSYRAMLRSLSHNIIHVPLEFPGRGARVTESLLSDIEDLKEDLFNQISCTLKNQRYAFYGHSLGGLLSYLLTHKIAQQGLTLPQHLFISGTCGPSAISRGNTRYYLLEKGEFMQKVQKLEGLPVDFFKNSELIEYYEPILRSDFKSSETYKYQNAPPLEVPFTIMYGAEEEIDLNEIFLWQNESKKGTSFMEFSGKHFFIFPHADKISHIISHELLRKTKSLKSL